MNLEKFLAFLFAVKTHDVCRVGCVNAFVVKTNPLENEVAIRRIDACTCVVAIARRMASVTAIWALVESWQRVVAYLSAAFCYVFPFLVFSALNFAHRAFDAFEIFALAAADITRFLT